MTVRSQRGRTRYVAYAIEAAAPVDLYAFVRALSAACPPRPDRPGARWAFAAFHEACPEGGRGLVRCIHLDQHAVCEALRSVHRIDGEIVRVRTLGVSGTARAAKRRFLGIDNPGRWRRGRTKPKRGTEGAANRADGAHRPTDSDAGGAGANPCRGG